MNEIFSEKVVTNRRTYYFDVKETKDGAKYLVIGELTQMGSEMERHRVMVFEESLDFFMEGLDKAVDFIMNNTRGGDEDGPRENGDREKSHEIEMLRRIEDKLDQIRRHFR
ncbi:MAG: hypothetical protein DMF61_02780 [Blastocatellia bacterium AA13]|nr:MAG: hypothetical protein DMF61_02780 [Blastocatellia bacterium AA13]